MTTKTISIERETYDLLAKEKRGRETLSQVVRRLVTSRPTRPEARRTRRRETLDRLAADVDAAGLYDSTYTGGESE